ncbi:MAG: ATP-binding protein [Pseudomonadota bacterium]
MRAWPRTLFGRLVAIAVLALLAAHVLNFTVAFYVQSHAARSGASYTVGRDMAALIGVLEQSPAAERAAWLRRLARREYTYRLGGPDGKALASENAARFAAGVQAALGPPYVVRASEAARPEAALSLGVTLADGTPLHVDVAPPEPPDRLWPGVYVVVQLVSIVFFTWLAVRQATMPLSRLADAADRLGTTADPVVLAEAGPLEVRRAASAFNAMGRRITAHLAERLQILAAIAHDLQTPITRMRLRADLMDDASQRNRIEADLDAMQALVEQGLAYARTANSASEAAVRLDVDAFIDALVCDYRDAGQVIRIDGACGKPVRVRLQALRRIVTNLVDNALRYAGDVEIGLGVGAGGALELEVRDRGPGIPEGELASVIQPYYRLEASRNRDTGGAGLGLAIVHQLLTAMGGTLELSNRPGGGLVARCVVPG